MLSSHVSRSSSAKGSVSGRAAASVPRAPLSARSLAVPGQAGQQHQQLSGPVAAGWHQQHAGVRQVRGPAPCRATLDDDEFKDVLAKLDEMRAVPSGSRDRLKAAIRAIDEANGQDPSSVTWEGQRYPYRLLYSQWVTEWVQKLDPKASDELLILARGRNVESWKLADIKRDDYAPNTAGLRQWEGDRKRWQARRVADIAKDAGYSAASVSLIEEVVLGRDIPDPRDIRRYDLVSPLGGINFKLLEEALMVQVLRDADALVYMEKSFPQMFGAMEAEKVLERTKRELARVSAKCMALLLRMPWTEVQRKLVVRALPVPSKFGSRLKEIEGVAAASTHPGDWRYRDFDYE